MFDNRRNVVICRIYLFGDVNNFAWQLALAVCNKGPKVLCHSIPPSNYVCKILCKRIIQCAVHCQFGGRFEAASDRWILRTEQLPEIISMPQGRAYH